MEIETYESYMVHFETDLNMIRSNLADLNLVTEERINYITDFQKNLTLIAWCHLLQLTNNITSMRLERKEPSIGHQWYVMA